MVETIIGRGEFLSQCRINVFEMMFKRNKKIHLVIINENFESPYVYAEDFFHKVEGLTKEAAAKYTLQEFIEHNDLFEIDIIYVDGEPVHIMKSSVIKDKLEKSSWNKYYKKKFQDFYDWMFEVCYMLKTQAFNFNFIETSYNNKRMRLFYNSHEKGFHVWFNAYDLCKILGNDNLNRYYVRDDLVLGWIDYSTKENLDKKDFMQKIVDIIYLCKMHEE